jgi:Kef-type K+ transport system membrane component KefB
VDVEWEHAVVLLLTGTLVASGILIKWGLERTALPALIGYLLLGFLLRVTGTAAGFLTEGMVTHFGFLADIGVIALLFRVGLESNLEGLLGQLRNARGIWIGNVLLSGVLGYFTSAYLLDLPLIPSLYIAVALTATSVAVPVAVWREAEALNSPNGELMLDVAELDDVSAILLMSLLFAAVPVLQAGANGALLRTILTTGVILLLKFLLFGAFCYVFARFVEHRLTRFMERIEPTPDPMLMLVASGSVIAALAGLMGFSIALGAFFAGLIYSRDPEAVKVSKPFVVIYNLFTPFFFIAIGLHIDPQLVTAAVIPGAILMAAAGLGKFIGTVAPAHRSIGWAGSVLLGVSMIPRAEIAMIVMQHGRALGETVVPREAFAAIVMVSAATCIFSPLMLRPMLGRWRQQQAEVNNRSSTERSAQ